MTLNYVNHEQIENRNFCVNACAKRNVCAFSGIKVKKKSLTLFIVDLSAILGRSETNKDGFDAVRCKWQETKHMERTHSIIKFSGLSSSVDYLLTVWANHIDRNESNRKIGNTLWTWTHIHLHNTHGHTITYYTHIHNRQK